MAALPPYPTDLRVPLSRCAKRASIFPDESYLSDMVQKALSALSKGIVWARGAIVNLVV